MLIALRFLIRPAIVAAVMAALAAPSAVAHPAIEHGHASVREGTPADEAQEYVSLGAAVEHAARQQRRHASHSVPPAAADNATATWRLAAVVEAIALAALAAGALVVALRGRRA